MDYLKLNRVEKAAILYLMYFQITESDESTYPHDSDPLNYYANINEELIKLGLPDLDDVLYDNDGQPDFDANLYLNDEDDAFEWDALIQSIAMLHPNFKISQDPDEWAIDVTYIGNLPFEFKYPY